MKVKIIGIPVLDQDKALQFYTEKLGFVKRHDIPVGGDFRWITVYSPEDPDGAEIGLEPGPLSFEPCKVYQTSLKEKGIPYTQFDVDDCEAEYHKLLAKGVEFSKGPTDVGTCIIAIFDDTVGNFIQLIEYK